MIDDKSYFRVVPSSEKNFGVVFSVVFFLVGIIPVFFSKPIIVWSIATSLLFLFLAFFFPKILVVPNRLWNKFGNFLGMIISPIVMLFIFVSTFLPIGLIFKALGKDIGCVGIGTWPLGGTLDVGSRYLGRSDVPLKRSMSVLKEALLSGINFIDTADIYGEGRSEKLIGRITQNVSQNIFANSTIKIGLQL